MLLIVINLFINKILFQILLFKSHFSFLQLNFSLLIYRGRLHSAFQEKGRLLIYKFRTMLAHLFVNIYLD